MKLLITGGSGFIGTNFIRKILLQYPGWEISNLDSITYAGNPYNLSDLNVEANIHYHFLYSDINNKNYLSNIFKEAEFDAVVHFAAESHVDRSISDPSEFIATNIIGTFNLLEASLNNWLSKSKSSRFKFIHISTDEVFGSLGPDGYFTEKTAYNPSSPYSASKASSDHLVRAYFQTYGLPTIITNCSNNYGPYQFPEKLIPLMILNILEHKSLPVYGDGKNVRDWIYVADHCEAILKIIKEGVPGESYNIGGNSELKNIDIVFKICDLLDKKLGRQKRSRDLIEFVKDRPGHDRRYAIDATKIKKKLSWTPRYKFEDAIELTIDWYLNNMDWVNSVRSGEYMKWIARQYGE